MKSDPGYEPRVAKRKKVWAKRPNFVLIVLFLEQFDLFEGLDKSNESLNLHINDYILDIQELVKFNLNFPIDLFRKGINMALRVLGRSTCVCNHVSTFACGSM